jgi:hypothetical protein
MTLKTHHAGGFLCGEYMTQSKVVLTQRPTIPFTAPNTVVLYVQNDRLYMKDDEQEIFLVGPISNDLSAIKAVTDNLPDSGALTSISDETDKIDDVATSGLTGVSNSLAYRVHEIERHLHSGARWYETAAIPDGEDHVADRLGSGTGAFQIDADNDDWGSWLQILGADDTPADVGKVYFDPHLLVISASERAAIYFIQFARGDSGDAGYAAGHYTELVLDLTNKAGGAIIPVQTGRAPAGSKLWARCMCPGQNTATVDFYIGIHEYEGV